MSSALLGSGVAQANTCRPWHIDLSAQYSESVYDEDGTLVYAEATGSGYASHIGEMTVLGLSYCAPPENGVLVIVDGTGFLTATNGDQIFVSFDGAAIDLATGAGAGTYVVTGGTGQFRGATGRAALSSTPLAPNGFTVVADGTLCF